MPEFTCPECGATCISITNGMIRCGQCGVTEQMPGIIKLRPNYPARWLTVNYLVPDSSVTGFEESPFAKGFKD